MKFYNIILNLKKEFEMETIIGTSIAILIMGVFLFVYLKTKDRKEPLTIVRVDDYSFAFNSRRVLRF